MKHRMTYFRLAAALALASLGCGKAKTVPGFSFEPQPRAVLQNIGVAKSWDPKMTAGASGTLDFVFSYEENNKDRLGFAMSHDAGDTYMPQITPISGAGVAVGTHGENSPSFVHTETDMYALWQEPEKDGTGRIMSAHSAAWGMRFDKPVLVSDKEVHAYAGYSTIAVAPNGDVYAVWLDGRDSKPNDETYSVYIAKSTDNGATFESNVRVAKDACPCCRPSIAFGSNGEVFVGWRRVFPGEIRDMVVSTSRDRGHTFSDPVRVHEDGWKLDGCPDSGPSLAQANGMLFITWMTAGKEDRPRIEVSRSKDGAKSFSTPVDISGDVVDANHPVMKIGDDGAVLVVFQGRAPSAGGTWNKTQGYVAQVEPDGTTSVAVAVPGSDNYASEPTITIGTGGHVFVAWVQPEQDRETIMLSRGRRLQ